MPEPYNLKFEETNLYRMMYDEVYAKRSLRAARLVSKMSRSQLRRLGPRLARAIGADIAHVTDMWARFLDNPHVRAFHFIERRAGRDPFAT